MVYRQIREFYEKQSFPQCPMWGLAMLLNVLSRLVPKFGATPKLFPQIGKRSVLRWSYPRKFPLRLVLVVPFVLQVSVAVGLTGYLSLRNGQRAVNDLATQLQDEVSDRVRQQLDTYLATPHQANQLIAKAMQLGFIDPRDLRGLGRYFQEQMRVQPNFSYINFGHPNGEFVGVGYSDEGELLLDLTEQSHIGTYYEYEVDRQGNPTNLIFADAYEHREDDWYLDAVQAGKPLWSRIYAWDSPPAIAVSASYPIYDATQSLVGVLGIDLLLDEIGTFLQQIDISSSGEVFILERNGLLVAASKAPEIELLGQEAEPRRIQASQSENVWVRATTEHLMQWFGGLDSIQTPQQLRLQVAGQTTFVQVTPWQDEFGLDWLIVVVVPESDFTARITANTRMTILLCLAALAIALVLGLITSHWIIQPIHRISTASEAIAQSVRSQAANRALNQTVAVQGIQELERLAQSFNQMAQQLQNAFVALERTNTELENRVDERTAELSKALANLQRTQTQLVQTEKMSSLGQLVAGMAHEINNPINFIYGNLKHADTYAQDLLSLLQLYQKHYPNPAPEIQAELTHLELDFLQEDLPKLHRSMKAGADRIRQIVLSLRTFSRIDEAELKTVHLHDGLDSTLTLLQSRLHNQHNGSEIQVLKAYGDLSPVECYAGQLNQVFMQLLTNAVEALEARDVRDEEDRNSAPPTIHLQTRSIDPDWVAIHITDNGLGMSETVQARMFEPFFTTKPVGRGTGLGLSICYQIVVEQHGGRLDCVSEPGQGTEFVVVIPTRISTPHSQAGSAPPHRPPAGPHLVPQTGDSHQSG